MEFIPKQIWKEEYDYYSDKSVDELKTDIQQLLDKTRGWDFSVNLTGKFTSEFEFEMTPKWQFAIIRGFEQKISYLEGQIFVDEFKRTRVTFNVRPNSTLLIFLFAFPMIGIFALTTGNMKGDKDDAKIAGLAFTFVVPAVMLLLGYFAKQDIKNCFVKAFDLKPVVIL